MKKLIEVSNMRPKGSHMEMGLKDFVSTLKVNCLVVEVGCFAGDATRIFLSRVAKVWCVDPWMDYVEDNGPGQVYQMIGMGAIESHFDEKFKVEISMGRVIKVKLPSAVAALSFRRIFDVVYLDGNHELESILEDIKVWMPKVRAGGILSGHDYDRNPVRRAVNEILGKPDSVFGDNTWTKHL